MLSFMQPLFKSPTADVDIVRHRAVLSLVLALYEMRGLLFKPFAVPPGVVGDICEVATRRFKQTKRLLHGMSRLNVSFDLWSAHVRFALGGCDSPGVSGLPPISAGCSAGGGMALYLHPVSEGLVVHLVAPSRYLVENLGDNLQVRVVPGLVHNVLRQVAGFLECHMPRFMLPSSDSGCTFTFVETLPDSPSPRALDPPNLGALPQDVLSVIDKGHGARIGYMMIGRLTAARSMAVTLALLRSGEFTHLVSETVAHAQWGLLGGANSPNAPAIHDDAFWEQLYDGGEGRIRRGLLTGWEALGRSPIGPNRVRTWVQWVGDRLRTSFGLGAGVLPPEHVM